MLFFQSAFLRRLISCVFFTFYSLCNFFRNFSLEGLTFYLQAALHRLFRPKVKRMEEKAREGSSTVSG